mmetsp:Transcript_3202/g.9289  ORF Transcript_3202/g.9289 Transcript_3202/m.9289 type:complete len:328 (-) Transcript_3202:628-1611(-)
MTTPTTPTTHTHSRPRHQLHETCRPPAISLSMAMEHTRTLALRAPGTTHNYSPPRNVSCLASRLKLSEFVPENELPETEGCEAPLLHMVEAVILRFPDDVFSDHPLHKASHGLNRIRFDAFGQRLPLIGWQLGNVLGEGCGCLRRGPQFDLRNSVQFTAQGSSLRTEVVEVLDHIHLDLLARVKRHIDHPRHIEFGHLRSRLVHGSSFWVGTRSKKKWLVLGTREELGLEPKPSNKLVPGDESVIVPVEEADKGVDLKRRWRLAVVKVLEQFAYFGSLDETRTVLVDAVKGFFVLLERSRLDIQELLEGDDVFGVAEHVSGHLQHAS